MFRRIGDFTLRVLLILLMSAVCMLFVLIIDFELATNVVTPQGYTVLRGPITGWQYHSTRMLPLP